MAKPVVPRLPGKSDPFLPDSADPLATYAYASRVGAGPGVEAAQEEVGVGVGRLPSI